MPNRSSQWAELLSPQLTEAFYIGFSDDGRRQSMIPAMFGMRTSQRAFEEHLGIGVLGSTGWNFEDTGRVQYDERNKGFKATFTPKEFAKGHIVQRKLVDDNLTDVAFDDAGSLGDSAFRLREKSAADVFANAFTTGTDSNGFPITGPDAVALCGAHPRSADDSTTQSNTGTSALSASAVSSTRITMQRFADDRGDLMNVMPDRLLVPPELEDTAKTITGSVLDPASANNAVNPQSGRFSTQVWHYLTDTNNWFMLDSGRQRRSLLWYERIPVEYRTGDLDRDTQQFKGTSYMRFSRYWRDPLFLYGHAVT